MNTIQFTQMREKCLKLLVFTLFFSPFFPMYGQSIVKIVPETDNGYLVLDRSDYPGLDRWECDLYYYEKDSIGTLDSNLIWSFYNNEDYFYFPKFITEPSAGAYAFDIRGYDASGGQLVSKSRVSPNDIPVDIGKLEVVGPVAERKCWKTCNGKVYPGDLFPYAYSISLYEYPSGGYYLAVEDGFYYDPNGEKQDYYAYYTQANFNTWCASCYNNAYQGRIILNIDGDNGNYTDIQGHPLSGPLVGVRKDAGPWKGLRTPEKVPGPYQNSVFNTSTAEEDCGKSFDWFKDKVNNYMLSHPSAYTAFPTLDCIPAQSSLPAGGYIPHGWTLAWLAWREEQLIKLPHQTAGAPPIQLPVADPFDNIWEVLRQAEDEAELNEFGAVETPGRAKGPGGVDPNIGNIIDRAIITDLTGSGGTTVLDLSDIYDNNGRLQAPSISLPAGLYRIALAYRNTDLKVRTIEAVTGLDMTYELSSMINISVVPSPLTNKTFKIDFDPGFTGSVNYELLDFNGNKIYSNTYSFTKDVQNSKTVSVINTIPTGVIFHRFTFPDGSVTTIKSLKK